jgi:hypothetical protein
MKVLLLVTGGRGGSDFFQGLLDEHKEVCQLPGVLKTKNELKQIISLSSPFEIAREFIKNYPNFFDSSKSSHERHNKLGKNKNQFYSVNKNKFLTFYNNLSKKKNLNNFEKLKNLHLAYYLAQGKNIKKLKILFIHTHTVEMTRKFLKIFNIKNFSIIHTMRNPVEAIYSPVKNWLNFKSGSIFFPKNLFFQIELALKGIIDLIRIEKKIYVILLEDLLKKRAPVMKDFCKIFKIKFSKSTLNCTFFGLQWWGDTVSGRWIGKKNANLKKKIKLNDFFFDKDIHYINYLTYFIQKKYYNQKYNSLNKKNIYINILPMKVEILVWKNTFKHKKIKHILSIPYYFLKRLIFLNKFFINYKFLPYVIGSRK